AQDGARAFLAGPEEPEEADEGVIRLYNEYISILVNTTEENTGRFAVQTTGGDPDRASDDNSPLIYLIPGQKPWTSYATVRIDGIDYVFGGRPTERAGRAGLYGEMLVAPHVVDDRRIETVYRIGPVDVTQVLSIIRSSTTGLLDTVRIEYRLVNTSDQVHHVGLRLMIDTMLGANDGAPFRVGELAITTDTVFEGDAIPEFWQAFDSLSDPKVTAQGTLKGDDVTPPDRVYFSNWGALADGLWEFDFQPGRDFTRLGEFELDSATALYWDPRPLAPGEERVYGTHYGLGGISISPGDLSIGVTSPSTVTADPDRTVTFPVVAYIQNTGEGEARNVVARIQLPQGLRLADGEQAVRQLGNLPTGRSAQVTWRVAVDRAVGGELTYT
ncbi:MAG: cellulosome anchor protein, partial [Clostridia bacterium]